MFWMAQVRLDVCIYLPTKLRDTLIQFLLFSATFTDFRWNFKRLFIQCIKFRSFHELIVFLSNQFVFWKRVKNVEMKNILFTLQSNSNKLYKSDGIELKKIEAEFLSRNLHWFLFFTQNRKSPTQNCLPLNRYRIFNYSTQFTVATDFNETFTCPIRWIVKKFTIHFFSISINFLASFIIVNFCGWWQRQNTRFPLFS